jgi:glycerophosphoryl diester phosphodiesterase
MIMFIIVWILLARPLLAWLAIAHRGLYHDVADNHALAENSVDALYRAYDLGLLGVEFDLRLDSSGEVLVVHDAISNRATVNDSYSGKLNPIDVALKSQPSVPAIHFADHSTKSWDRTPLKAYGLNGGIVHQTDGIQRLETLDAMLAHFKNLNAPNFWLILDIQNPTILRLAGALVQKYNLSTLVFLKFFATKAINSEDYYYGGNGFDICNRYALDNNLSGLNIIPQINDGELTYANGRAYLKVFHTTLAIQDYLQCWADAQRAYSGNGAALLLMVSASVPSKNKKNYKIAYQAALDAMNWAKANDRQKMSIVPNPDAGRLINGQCTFWMFQSEFVNAVRFDQVARSSKFEFATGPANADYIVVDLMGDFQNRLWHPDEWYYNTHLC